ncbi:MAG: MFS transporter [Clostridiales bacterium]|nr:MFS transporter [Clostridiales bacterium]
MFSSLKKYWSKPGEGRYLSIKEIACFGGGGMGIYLVSAVMGTFISAFKIPEIYSIGVEHGQIIFFIASTAGLFAQPLFGKLLHKTKTKWGKYKPYLMFMAPVVGVFVLAATWLPDPNNSQEGLRALQAYLTCVPALILYNVWINLFNMMPAVITPNQQERSDIWSPIGLIINLAPSLFNPLSMWFRSSILGSDPSKEFLVIRFMGAVSVAFSIVLVMLMLKVKERVYETEKKVEKIKISEGLKLVLQNKPLMILTLALTLGCLRSVADMSSETIGRLRYAETFKDGLEIFGTLTLVTGFAATPNMIILPLLARKFNNRTIMLGWQIFSTLSYVALAAVGSANLQVGLQSTIVLTAAKFCAGFNAIGSLIPLMLSEIYDYQQWKTGKRLEGFIQTFAYAVVGFVSQIAMFIPVAIQKHIGYNPKDYFNVERESVAPEVLARATEYFDIALLISAVSGILMILALLFYNLDKKKYAQIMAELKARKLNTVDGEKTAETTANAAAAETGTAG